MIVVEARWEHDLSRFLTGFVNQSVSARIMGRLAQLQEKRMKTRTLAGKNYEGNPFPAYTEPYKKIRRKEGRQVSPVNLKRTGHMLNSMSHHDFANKTIIDFGPDESARAHGLTTGKYPFFAISVDDEDALGKEIIRQMRKQRAKRGGQ